MVPRAVDRLQRRDVEGHGPDLVAVEPGPGGARRAVPPGVAGIVGHGGEDALVQPEGAEIPEGRGDARHPGGAAALVMGMGQPEPVQQFVHDRGKARPARLQIAAVTVPAAAVEKAHPLVADAGRVEDREVVAADLVGVEHDLEIRLRIGGDGEVDIRHRGDRVEGRLEAGPLEGGEPLGGGRGPAVHRAEPPGGNEVDRDLGVGLARAPQERVDEHGGGPLSGWSGRDPGGKRISRPRPACPRGGPWHLPQFWRTWPCRDRPGKALAALGGL